MIDKEIITNLNILLDTPTEPIYIIAEKVLKIAKASGDNDFAKYLLLEIDGYLNKEDVPSYRIVSMQLAITDPHLGYIKVEIPSENIRESLSSTRITEPLYKIHKLANDNPSGFASILIEHELVQRLIPNYGSEETTLLLVHASEFRKIELEIRYRIKKWIRSFDENIIIEKVDYKINDLVPSLLQSLIALQETRASIATDENKYNDILKVLYQQKISDIYFILDQSRQGFSSSEHSSRSGVGQPDFIIKLKRTNQTITIIEALRAGSIDQKNIKEHLEKLLDYDTVGLSHLFFIVYCESSNLSSFWNKYLEFDFSSFLHFKSIVDVSIEFIQDPHAEIKIARMNVMNREREVVIYHTVIGMWKPR